jgi:S1-C subfamily serine protease
VQVTPASTSRRWLLVAGLVLATGCAAAAIRSADARAIDVSPGADPVSVSVVANAVTVVRVTASTCNGLETGSGIVFDGGLVVTASHVVRGASRVTIDVDGLGAVSGAVIGVDGTGRDVAVIDVPALVGQRGAPTSAATLTRGTEVSAAGHPRGGVRQTLAGVVVGYVDSGPMAADGGRVLTVSMDFEPGMSGGPVVDRRGRVVGVVIGVERTSGTGIAVPAGEIGPTLRGEGLRAPATCGAGS